MSIESGALELIRKLIELDDKWQESKDPDPRDRKAQRESMQKTQFFMEQKARIESEMRGYLNAVREIEKTSKT